MSATFRVSLPDGAHFATAADENLLTAAQRAHWLVRFGCRNGNCEACAATLLQGRVRHRDGRLIEATASEIFLCLCYAQSDVQIALPSDPLPGSFEQSLRSYAQLRRQIVAEGASTLYFTLPAGRSPAILEGQIALIETNGGSLQVAIDHERSQGRELVVRLMFASPLAEGAYYHLRYPLRAAPL